MLDIGDPIPDAMVWTAPREIVSLENLTGDSPILLLFYLFDWSAT